LSTVSLPVRLLSNDNAFASNLELFQLFSHQLQSKIQVKSGRIINKVGKSVNLLATSSICLVTQSINQLGNGLILFIFIFNTSSKFQAESASISTHTAISESHQAVNKGAFGVSVKSHGKKSNAFSTGHFSASFR
jgi:hypothetical protein